MTTPVTESGLVRMALDPTVTSGPPTATHALESLRSLRRHERAEFLPDHSSLAEPSIERISGRGGRRGSR
ncbi:hypothetical protein FXB39_02815 [Nocardioides sp. BGMRC 2183]|nr:hypothetical protein FXB39_02815 [Nocardioides sp. BGMRC 2183]